MRHILLNQILPSFFRRQNMQWSRNMVHSHFTMLEGPWLHKTAFATPMVRPLDESQGSSPSQGHGSWLMCGPKHKSLNKGSKLPFYIWKAITSTRSLEGYRLKHYSMMAIAFNQRLYVVMWASIHKWHDDMRCLCIGNLFNKGAVGKWSTLELSLK